MVWPASDVINHVREDQEHRIKRSEAPDNTQCSPDYPRRLHFLDAYSANYTKEEDIFEDCSSLCAGRYVCTTLRCFTGLEENIVQSLCGCFVMALNYAMHPNICIA